MNKRIRSVTLIELLIAISLLSVVVLVLSSIDFFSRHHVISSDRRAKLQNEASFVLEHMSKEIIRAIGNERINGQNSVVMIGIIGGNAISVYIDANQNGRRDLPNDRWIAYRFTGVVAADNYQVQYCPQCIAGGANPCNTCLPAWGTITENTLSRRIINFQVDKPMVAPPVNNTLSGNYIEIVLTACWDPDGIPNACGTVDNPDVVMRTRIFMPSVSTN